MQLFFLIFLGLQSGEKLNLWKLLSKKFDNVFFQTCFETSTNSSREPPGSELESKRE